MKNLTYSYSYYTDDPNIIAIFADDEDGYYGDVTINLSEYNLFPYFEREVLAGKSVIYCPKYKMSPEFYEDALKHLHGKEVRTYHIGPFESEIGVVAFDMNEAELTPCFVENTETIN